MRSKKELLELLLENVHLIEGGGLCWAIMILTGKKVISLYEKVALDKIIKTNPTMRFSKGDSLYYFPAGRQRPRIKYLKQLIKKYENK